MVTTKQDLYSWYSGKAAKLVKKFSKKNDKRSADDFFSGSRCVPGLVAHVHATDRSLSMIVMHFIRRPCDSYRRRPMVACLYRRRSPTGLAKWRQARHHAGKCPHRDYPWDRN